jgi:hypothetical protein
VYEWQSPSKRIKDVVVQFQAKMRMRGAGYKQVLSPEFDDWDGWNVIVPKNTLWRELESKEQSKNILVVGCEEVFACPYCEKIPILVGIEESYSGGITICAHPHEFNSWWLECCRWARTPHFSDPRELITTRNRMLSKYIKSAQ